MIARRTLLALAVATPAAAQAPAPVAVDQPWTRAALQGGNGAGFMVLRSTTGTADRLVSAASPVARVVELHTHIREGDVMRMRPVEAIPVPASGTTRLEPGGLHVMLIGLQRPLATGETIPLTLTFEKAGTIVVNLPVLAAGARGPGGHGH